MNRYIVVDDDPTNNLICRLLIERFQPEAEIRIYTKPEDALIFIEREKDPQPSILFLDVNMPTMTGWEFMDEFATFDEKVKNRYKIFILSSSYEDFSSDKEIYPNLTGVFSKPLKAEHIEGIEA